MREWPQLPADFDKKYAQRQVVILAIVDKEGKVSHISVKQTPDARVSEPSRSGAKQVGLPSGSVEQSARSGEGAVGNSAVAADFLNVTAGSTES